MDTKIINFVAKTKKNVFTKFAHQKSKIGHKLKIRRPNYNSDFGFKNRAPHKILAL